MIRSTQKELVASLEKHGMQFTFFNFVLEGEYLPTDADWNYKDVPHLNLVHELVDACYASVGDDYIATVNMQQVLGFRFPLSLFNYQSGPNRQTYFTSFFVYQLVLETTYEQIGPLRTAVTTSVAIGSFPFWQIFVPILKWQMKRNYNNLMSADIPMRARRGELRKWGYTFKGDAQPYSFQDTMKISENNLIPPAIQPLPSPEVLINLDDLEKQKTILVGRNDTLGLRIELGEQNDILVFPRTCPHEGASLDGSPCKKEMLSCPWHGRAFQPLARLSSKIEGSAAHSGTYAFRVENQRLAIRRMNSGQT